MTQRLPDDTSETPHAASLHVLATVAHANRARWLVLEPALETFRVESVRTRGEGAQVIACGARTMKTVRPVNLGAADYAYPIRPTHPACTPPGTRRIAHRHP